MPFSLPYNPQKMKQKLTSYMVSGMMAFLESASPALLASDTASPKGLKQGTGVNSTTWCTLVTSRPCSKYYLRRGVDNKIFLLSYFQSSFAEAEPWCYALLRTLSWSLQYHRGWCWWFWRWGIFHWISLSNAQAHEYPLPRTQTNGLVAPRSKFAPGS